MAFMASSQTRSKGYTWQGILMMICLLFLALLQFNLFGVSLTLLFLPMAAICLWPRGASPLASIIVLFLFGLMMDFLSAGPFGMWSIIFLTQFALFRPYMRTRELNFAGAMGQWVLMLVGGGLLAFGLAWFGSKHRPDIMILIYQVLAALVVFPLIYAVRSFFRGFAIDPDDKRF